MSGNKSSYRGIMKGTAIFGGVQVISILVSIVRAKIIAIFLGPAGSGLFAMFSSAINPITLLSSLGLNYSAVRKISQSTEQGDDRELAQTVHLARRWFWFTALLGGMATVALSPVLSRATFDNADYTWAFMLLGVAVITTILSNGEVAIMQGTRRLKLMAKASILNTIIGLLLTVPFIYFMGQSGIVPIIIISAVVGLAINYFYSRKIAKESLESKLSVGQTWYQGKDLVGLGVVFMFSNAMAALSVYAMNALISLWGSLQDVGIYQSGSSLTNQYIGLVFTAMAVDYFPRLAAISSDKAKLSNAVNQQAEITTLIIFPMLALMIMFAPLLIKVLLTEKYNAAIPLIRYISFGLIIKAAAFALGYIAGGVNDKKFIFWFEGIWSVAQTLAINIVGYALGGIDGLGISFIISYVLYFVEITYFAGRRYGFRFDKVFLKIFGVSLVVTGTLLAITLITDNAWIHYAGGGALTVLSGAYSYKELNKRMNIREFISKKTGRS